jgi:hypothetical protein
MWDCPRRPGSAASIRAALAIPGTVRHRHVKTGQSYCVVPIVEDDYAFSELVRHRVTGFMTSDSDEMSYYASLLAYNPRMHREMAAAGREFLEYELANDQACWEPWLDVL